LADDRLLRRIHAIVSLASRDGLKYDVALILDEGTLSGMVLDADVAPRLGVDTFLISRPRHGLRKILLDLPRPDEESWTGARSYSIAV
jgi:predicted component of type VI protein secretion system